MLDPRSASSLLDDNFDVYVHTPHILSWAHSLSLLLSHLLILPWACHAQMTFVTLQLKSWNLSPTSPISWQTEANIYCLLPDYLTHFSDTTETSLHGWAAFYQLVSSSDVNIIVSETSKLASDTVGKESLLAPWPPAPMVPSAERVRGSC